MDIYTRINDQLEHRNIGADTYEITIARNSDVGDGNPVDLKNLAFDQYERNPIVRWNHGHTNEGLPIARSKHIYRQNDGAIRAQFEFLPGDDFAARVKNAWDRGFIRAASITWMNPKASGQSPQLREWSLVDIPADADAVRSVAKSTLQYLLDQPLNNRSQTQGDLNLNEVEIKALVGDMLKEALPKNNDDNKGGVDVDGLRSAITDTVTKLFEQRDASDKKAAEESERAKKLEVDMRAQANTRPAILTDAKPYLPADVSFDALSNREIMERALGDTVKVDKSRSDDYVLARFEAFIENARSNQQAQGQPQTLNTGAQLGVQTPSLNAPTPTPAPQNTRSAQPLSLSLLDMIKLKQTSPNGAGE